MEFSFSTAMQSVPTHSIPLSFLLSSLSLFLAYHNTFYYCWISFQISLCRGDVAADPSSHLGSYRWSPGPVRFLGSWRSKCYTAVPPGHWYVFSVLTFSNTSSGSQRSVYFIGGKLVKEWMCFYVFPCLLFVPRVSYDASLLVVGLSSVSLGLHNDYYNQECGKTHAQCQISHGKWSTH